MSCVTLKNRDWQVEEVTIINNNGNYKLAVEEIVNRCASLFQENNLINVLDLGCGKGRISLFLAEKGFNVYSVDHFQEALVFLQEKIRSKNMKNIKVFNCNFTDLCFEEHYFDAVISRSTLHHTTLENVKKGINEALRVLKPGGYFVFDLLSQEDSSFGAGEKVEENTFIGSREGEEGILHHYTDLKELECMLKQFSEVEIYKNEYLLVFKGKEFRTKVYDVIAIK